MTATARTEETASERTFERLTLGERLQHGILVVSFTLLVITGLPVKYHDTPWAGWLFWLMGGVTGRALLHRAAAVVLISLSVYHVLFLFFTQRGRDEVAALTPRLQDVRDAVAHIAYYLGLRPAPPRFPRFSYIEKFEYLALVWGSIVMIGTGFLLWFEQKAMLVFPKWVLDVCRIMHGYEAVLAFLAIIIWHLYCVHLNPDVFPMSRVWLDGRITESQMKHHHPLEYEEIMRREREAQAAQALPREAELARAAAAADNGQAEPAHPESMPTRKGEDR